jgi:modulator of FtsH protease
MRVGYPNIFVVLIGFYGLFFLTNKLRDSAWGLVSAFALTGFMGFILGPILNRYLGMAGGAQVVSSAFAMTALVFGGLSAYVLVTRKDMSFLGGFITAGFFVLLAAVVAGMFFQISGLQLAISAGFVLFSSVRSSTAVSVTTSWRPSACMCRSTTCLSACCRSSAS